MYLLYFLYRSKSLDPARFEIVINNDRHLLLVTNGVTKGVTKWRFRDYGPRGRNHLRGPCLKFFVNQDYPSSPFSLKLLCPKGVFKSFPVISFQFFLRSGAPLGYQKCGAWGRGPLAPP